MKVLKLFRNFITAILAISAILSFWTTFALLNKGPLNKEISAVLKEMYSNQISFLSNVKDLSVLLVKESQERVNNKNSNDLSSNTLMKEKDSDLTIEDNVSEADENISENTLEKTISIIIEPHDSDIE